MDLDAVALLSGLHQTVSFGNRRGSRKPETQVAPFVDFRTIDADVRGRGDPETDAALRDGQDRDADGVTDRDLFSDPPRQHQRGHTSLGTNERVPRTDAVPRSSAAPRGLALSTRLRRGTWSSAGRTAVVVGMSVLKRTRTNAQLSTLDVRQIRRGCLGRWKPPGMESNTGIVSGNESGG
jgi:hypothetical protein